MRQTDILGEADIKTERQSLRNIERQTKANRQRDRQSYRMRQT